MIEDCIHLLSLRAEKRDITMTEAIEHQLPRIWADERAVRQVTLNLLTNAIKFTPPGGSVFVKAGWTAMGGQYLSIRDTGTGIPADEIPIVLSSFGRGSLAQKNADEGSGLGLPIVKGLVELHGGTFTLKSEVRVGHGSDRHLPARARDGLAAPDRRRGRGAHPPPQPRRAPPDPATRRLARYPLRQGCGYAAAGGARMRVALALVCTLSASARPRRPRSAQRASRRPQPPAAQRRPRQAAAARQQAASAPARTGAPAGAGPAPPCPPTASRSTACSCPDGRVLNFTATAGTIRLTSLDSGAPVADMAYIAFQLADADKAAAARDLRHERRARATPRPG